LRPEGPVSLQFIGEGKTLSGMLETGEIDAMIGAREPASLRNSPQVQRLFPNYRETEREYYRKTGIFPIMHTLVVKESVYRQNPWIVHSLYKAFSESKRLGLEQARFSGTLRYMLPWLYADLQEVDEVFGSDPWPYGLEANRKTLQTLVDYLVDQRFLPQPAALEAMFTPITEGSYDK
jgi:4,5-dihydroxyphthalate decarboxylase